MTNNKNIGLNTEEDLLLTKKGTLRKRKPKKSQIYFTQDTEDAIVSYNSSKDEIYKNRLFDEKIDYALHKLAENIIHTFKFYYTEVDSIKELKHEVVTVLLEKLPLYHHSKNINDKLRKIIIKEFKEEYKLDSFLEFTNNSVTVTQEQINEFLDKLNVSKECMDELAKITPPKAYSYFGTIAKRYLINYNNINYKKLKGKAEVKEVDTDDTIYNNIVLENTNKELELGTFIYQFTKFMYDGLDEFFPKKNEAKVVDAILTVLNRGDNTDVPFSKKALYIVVRDMTDVSTPQITKTIKKLEQYYILLYNDYYKNGFISGT